LACPTDKTSSITNRSPPPPQYFALQQSQASPTPAQYIHAIAQATAGFPDVCSGGAFVYAGVQGKVGSGHGFAGYLGNYDSKEGWSNNGLFEGSKGNASGGVAAGSKGAEGLVFIPFAEAGGGLIGVSKMVSRLGAMWELLKNCQWVPGEEHTSTSQRWVHAHITS
jgi:hypothetical protein